MNASDSTNAALSLPANTRQFYKTVNTIGAVWTRHRRGGFSALVTFAQDGTHPKVEVYFSTDKLVPVR